MKRPAFQMYARDWLSNVKLRRCSLAARGAWIDVMCLMHDSAEYGVLRWPLVEIARAANVPVSILKELASRSVLKGAESGATDYIYRPRHAGKEGDPVTLLVIGEGPCWYCSRFVRDEWVRQHRGSNTRFGTDKQPPSRTPKVRVGEPQGESPNREPTGPKGDGASTASASLSSKENKPSRKRSVATPLPEGFAISERVATWAVEKGHDRLDEHLEAFLGAVRAKGYTYVDWDDAFMNAIRKDWAELKSAKATNGHGRGPDWSASNEGIDAKGRELDMQARPSESYADFKQRIFDRLRAKSSTPKTRPH